MGDQLQKSAHMFYWSTSNADVNIYDEHYTGEMLDACGPAMGDGLKTSERPIVATQPSERASSRHAYSGQGEW